MLLSKDTSSFHDAFYEDTKYPTYKLNQIKNRNIRVAGFEPATSRSQNGHATRLRHTLCVGTLCVSQRHEMMFLFILAILDL